MKVTQKFTVNMEIEVEYDVPEGMYASYPYTHITGYVENGQAIVIVPEGQITDINFKSLNRLVDRVKE